MRQDEDMAYDNYRQKELDAQFYDPERRCYDFSGLGISDTECRRRLIRALEQELWEKNLI